MPLLALSASVGKIVAILALLPPWILIYLVSGKEGLKDGWPLAIVGSLGYIAGQFPVSIYLGPYLPDVIGSIVCFACLLLLLKVWRPAQVLGYGGVPVAPRRGQAPGRSPWPQRREIFHAWMPIIVLVVVVVAWTGPWSPLPGINWLHLRGRRRAPRSTPGATISAAFDFKPCVGGSAILASWIVVALLLRVNLARSSARSSPRPGQQMWGACLVGVFIFGLAYVFNYSGMAGSLASAFSKIGCGLHRGRADPGLHRRRAVGHQHLDQRDVRQVPGAGRAVARLPADAAADAELGRRRDRQADRAADRQRRRLDQPFRAQRGRGHPPQLRVDLRAPVYLVLIGVACYLFFPDIAALPK